MTCCHLTKKGTICTNKGCHVYENNTYCGVHMKYIKAREECCICFQQMDKPSQKIRLICKHYFHKQCLASCIKPECPCCRKEFAPPECLEIYKENIVKPLMMEIFLLNGQNQGIMIDSIKRLTSIANKSNVWPFHALHYIIQILQNSLNTNQQNLCLIVSIIQTALAFIEAKGDLNGFNVYVQQDKIYMNP